MTRKKKESFRHLKICQHSRTNSVPIRASCVPDSSPSLAGAFKGPERVRPTFVHAREAVLQHSELVDLAELLEEGPEVLLVQVAGDLADKEFDGIVVLHGYGGRASSRAVA